MINRIGIQDFNENIENKTSFTWANKKQDIALSFTPSDSFNKSEVIALTNFKGQVINKFESLDSEPCFKNKVFNLFWSEFYWKTRGYCVD